jgi:hypothetical protein
MTRHLRSHFFRLAASAVVLSLFIASASAFAQSSANAKKEKKTTLNFEDELVEGQTSKPELFYLFQKKNFNYKRLIRLRENFLPEMRKTSEDIQRGRSSN